MCVPLPTADWLQATWLQRHLNSLHLGFNDTCPQRYLTTTTFGQSLTSRSPTCLIATFGNEMARLTVSSRVELTAREKTCDLSGQMMNEVQLDERGHWPFGGWWSVQKWTKWKPSPRKTKLLPFLSLSESCPKSYVISGLRNAKFSSNLNKNSEYSLQFINPKLTN